MLPATSETTPTPRSAALRLARLKTVEIPPKNRVRANSTVAQLVWSPTSPATVAALKDAAAAADFSSAASRSSTR